MLSFLLLPWNAQAAIALRGTGKIAGVISGADVTLTFDTGGSAPQTGDLVIVFGGSGSDGVPTTKQINTAGYTEITLTNGADVQVGAWYKIMGSTPDLTVQGEGGGDAGDGVAYGAYVIDGSTVISTLFDQTTTSVGQVTGVPDGPSIVTQTAGAGIITLAGGHLTDTTPGTVGGGYANQLNTADGTDTDDITLASATFIEPSPSTEDPAAWSSWTSANYIAKTIALKPPVIPTVTTQSASSVTATTATLNGTITATSSIRASARGFAWGTNSALSGGDTATTTETGNFGPEAFTNTSITFVCNTTYYSRAYATNGEGNGLGAISSSFTTSACASPPTATTNFANAGFNSAILHGTKTGGDNATEHGFAYSTDSAVSTGVSTTTLGSLTSNSSFSSAVTGLTASLTYYFRAYATNTGGTGYGAIKSFTTGNSTATRKLRLFNGFTIKFISGQIILHQQ